MTIRKLMMWPSAALLLSLAVPAFNQDAVSQIRSEIERVQRSLTAKPIQMTELRGVSSTIGDFLRQARESLDKGQVYASLEKLDLATDYLAGVRLLEEKAEVVGNDLPAFEKEWGRASLALTALDRDVRTKKWDNSRAAVRALAETALVKTTPLLEGGRGFATATKPRDGLFYLGQAQGEAEFAKFTGTLNLPRTSRAFALRSMLPELQALQQKTNAAFVPPRSIDQHPRFIALNSTLKLAHELDSSRFYAGAMYQYLEAVRHFAMLDAQEVDTAAQAATKQNLSSIVSQLDKSKQDESIAQIFVERAQSQIAAGGKDEWRSARVIVEQVIPAYLAARKPASRIERAAAKTVEITLVRWPYT